MLGIKTRVGILGLLTMMVVGAFASSSAQAQGPVWYHRTSPGCGCQAKISAKEPEYMAGGGGKQKLRGTIGGTAFEITAGQAQIKAEIYNNNLQAQTKIQISYHELKLANPNFPNCVVTVGTGNVIKVYGHQMWKWDGTSTQLHEQPVQQQRPDWVFLPTEPQQEATELPNNNTFTTIKLTGAECGILAGTYPVKGSVAAAITPPNLGEWGFNETQKIWPTSQKQHFFNGKENIGAETKLTFGGTAAELEGEFSTKTIGRQQNAPQEIAHFEQ